MLSSFNTEKKVEFGTLAGIGYSLRRNPNWPSLVNRSKFWTDCYGLRSEMCWLSSCCMLFLFYGEEGYMFAWVYKCMCVGIGLVPDGGSYYRGYVFIFSICFLESSLVNPHLTNLAVIFIMSLRYLRGQN